MSTYANNICRITLILVSRWSSRRSSTFLSKSFSPRHFVKSLTGLSSPSMRTGTSKTIDLVIFDFIPAFCEGVVFLEVNLYNVFANIFNQKKTKKSLKKKEKRTNRQKHYDQWSAQNLTITYSREHPIYFLLVIP